MRAIASASARQSESWQGSARISRQSQLRRCRGPGPRRGRHGWSVRQQEEPVTAGAELNEALMVQHAQALVGTGTRNRRRPHAASSPSSVDLNERPRQQRCPGAGRFIRACRCPGDPGRITSLGHRAVRRSSTPLAAR